MLKETWDAYQNVISRRLYNSFEMDELIQSFNYCLYEKPGFWIRFLFFIRDIDQGWGRRTLFRKLVNNIEDKNIYYLIDNMHLIPKYGRWDDVIELTYHNNPKVRSEAFCLIENQLEEDLFNLYTKHSTVISQLAKWLPSESTASRKTKEKAIRMARELGLSLKEYRQKNSRLRKHLQIIESYITNKDYTFDYNNVPFTVKKRLGFLLLRKDYERFCDHNRNSKYHRSLRLKDHTFNYINDYLNRTNCERYNDIKIGG